MSIPETTLKTLWSERFADPDDARDVAQLLVERSLISRDHNRCYRLHDLYHDYLRAAIKDLPRLHHRLVTTYYACCHDGWPSGPNDGYFFQFLPYHLAQGGDFDILRSLLLNYDWINAKLRATDISAIIADYRLVANDEDTQLVQQALRLAGLIISRDSTQLPSQLVGRLGNISRPEIQNFVSQATDSRDTPWLYPVIANLTQPGGTLLQTFFGHKGWVSSVAITPDGRRVVSGSHDNTIRVWDLDAGTLLYTLEAGDALAVTLDGQRVVSGSLYGIVRVWDLATGTLLHTLHGHSRAVQRVTVTPDGRRAISSSIDKTVRSWDLETGTLLHTLILQREVSDMAVLPDGQRFISSSYDTTLKIWDLETGTLLHTLHGHSGAVYTIAVTPDGRRAVSGSQDQTVRVWAPRRGHPPLYPSRPCEAYP